MKIIDKDNKESFKAKGNKKGFALLGFLLLFLFSGAEDFNWSFHNSTAIVYSVTQIIMNILIVLGPIYLIYIGLKRKNKNNSSLIFILSIVSIFVIISRVPDQPKGFNIEGDISTKIEIGNKKLPIMIDEHTRLDDVSVEGSVLKRYFTLVNLNKGDEFSILFTLGLKQALILTTCSEEIPQELKDYDFEFIYYDKNGEFITKESINPEVDCNGSKDITQTNNQTDADASQYNPKIYMNSKYGFSINLPENSFK